MDHDSSSPTINKDKDSKKGAPSMKQDASQDKKDKENDGKESALGGTGLNNDTSAISIVKLPERDNIDNDFKPVIIKLW